MLLYTEEIVRVGGSSRSEKLKNYTLNELLKGSNSDKQQIKQLESDRYECEKRIDQLTGYAVLPMRAPCIHTQSTLKKSIRDPPVILSMRLFRILQ